MAIKTITTFVRPNSNVAFWKFDDATKAHVASTYPAINATVTQTESPDGLTRVVTRTYPNQAAVDAWKADPVITAAGGDRAAYCTANGIRVTGVTASV